MPNYESYQVIKEITLDLVAPGLAPVVNVPQYDTKGRVVKVNLVSNSAAYEIESDFEVHAVMSKKDGKSVNNPCVVDGSTVYAVISKQMTVFEGRQMVAISITNNSDVELKAFPFVLNVIRAPSDAESYASEDEHLAFETAYKKVLEAKTAAENGKRAGDGIMKRRIVFATGNENKMKEIRMILSDLNTEIVSMKEAGVDIDIVEDGMSFEENAEIKARSVARILTNDIVLADDSGLEIDYLDKAPGIYSARFAGEDTSYDIKNRIFLDRLEGVPDEERTARFVCAVAAVFPDGSVDVVRETIEGRIAHESAGTHGFGYDPIFYLPEYGCTSAELSMEEKNKISHRGKALRAIKDELR